MSALLAGSSMGLSAFTVEKGNVSVVPYVWRNQGRFFPPGSDPLSLREASANAKFIVSRNWSSVSSGFSLIRIVLMWVCPDAFD